MCKLLGVEYRVQVRGVSCKQNYQYNFSIILFFLYSEYFRMIQYSAATRYMYFVVSPNERDTSCIGFLIESCPFPVAMRISAQPPIQQ